MKTKVTVEEIEALNAMLEKYNSLDMENIEWYQNGEKLNVPKEIIDDFRFVGLSIRSFVELGWHEFKTYEEFKQNT